MTSRSQVGHNPTAITQRCQEHTSPTSTHLSHRNETEKVRRMLSQAFYDSEETNVTTRCQYSSHTPRPTDGVESILLLNEPHISQIKHVQPIMHNVYISGEKPRFGEDFTSWRRRFQLTIYAWRRAILSLRHIFRGRAGGGLSRPFQP